ncbi:MFS transporter [Bacillus sp. 03113]|uniref:MFS transporter n=1 Tax=Bacillus sp. 03113 TaxID=2578211 RepID=UPI001142626D|nr:MFS transporter [Bacillus sp. 03113]
MSRKSFVLLACIMFLSMTGYGVVLPALPYLARSIGLSSFQMGSLITGWAFAQFLIVPFWGRMIDRIGRKPVLLFGLFGFGLAFLLLIFAKSYLHLLIIRIIGAILSSGTQPAAYAIVIDSFDKKERSAALAKMAAANALGFLCGPVVGAVFSPFGIEVPFIVAGMFSLLAVPLAWIYLKEPVQKNQPKKTPSFFSSLKIVSKSGYRELLIITFGLAIAASSLFSMLGYYMMENFGSKASQTGLAFSIQSMAAVVIQLFIMKHIYEKYKEEGIAKTGLLIEAAGYSCVGMAFSLWMIFLGCILVGMGQALSRPSLLTLLAKKDSIGQGLVMGFQQSMDSLGRSIGPLLAGWIFLFNSSGPFIIALCITLVLFFFFTVGVQKNAMEIGMVGRLKKRVMQK